MTHHSVHIAFLLLLSIQISALLYTTRSAFPGEAAVALREMGGTLPF